MVKCEFLKPALVHPGGIPWDFTDPKYRDQFQLVVNDLIRTSGSEERKECLPCIGDRSEAALHAQIQRCINGESEPNCPTTSCTLPTWAIVVITLLALLSIGLIIGVAVKKS